MNKGMRIRIAAVLLAAALGGGAWWYLAQDGREADGTLTLYGNVDIREVGLSFRVGGRIAKMRFEEGDRVRAGTAVARLDPVPFEEDLAVAQAERDAAAARLAKMEAGPREQEIVSARARLAERQAALVNAERNLERQSKLLAGGNTPRQSYDDALTRRDQAQAALATARAELALLEDGFRAEDVAAARAEHAAAQARVAQARTRLADATVEAPSDGTILSRVHEPGAVVAAGASVYTLALSEPLWVRAYVPEPELGRVKPGMRAEIVTDTEPETVHAGQVGFVSPVAEFTPKTVQTPDLRTDLVFRLRVVVPDPGDGLRQGMPVTVRLIEEPRDGGGDGGGNGGGASE